MEQEPLPAETKEFAKALKQAVEERIKAEEEQSWEEHDKEFYPRT